MRVHDLMQCLCMGVLFVMVTILFSRLVFGGGEGEIHRYDEEYEEDDELY